MTDTPMTPDRERMIRIWHEELARLTDRAAVMRREALGDLLAEIARLRGELSDATAELAENTRAMNALRRHRDTAESRLTAVERLAEEADDKCNSTVDTDLLLDALGLNADTPFGARVADELAEGLAGLDAMRADHPAPCRVPDSPDCTCSAQCQDCGAPAPAAGTRMWHRIGCPQRSTR